MFNPNLAMQNTPHITVNPAIEVNGLHLALSGETLLKDISVTSYTQGVTMVMGANGAGKSLFLRCLHGLLNPTSGTIRLNGESLTESRSAQAMVFQKATLLRRTVLQNLQFAAPAGTTMSDIRSVLEKVHLAAKEKNPARMLSGGEQQRLALARALLTRPRVLLLDEPTASLDPASVLIIEGLINNAKLEGVKSIFVSHDIGQAKRLASDIIFLHQGRITEHTDAETFFTSPQSKEAKAYLAGEIVL